MERYEDIRRRKMNSKSKLIYQKTTKLVRIDAGLHRLLKLKAIEEETTIKGLLQDYLIDLLAVKNDSK